MYHFIYITVNAVNMKFYIGKHSTNNMDDNYIGSGFILKRAILKYGRENFYRLNIEFLESEELAFKKEKEIITKVLELKTDACYNIGGGGEGGDNISNNPKREKILEKMAKASKIKWEDPIFRKNINEKRAIVMQSNVHRDLRSSIAKGLWKNKKYRDKTTESIKISQKTETCKENKSKASIKKWKNPDYKEKIMSTLTSEKHREKLSLSIKKLYAERPEIKAQQAKTRSLTLQRPEYKEKLSQIAKDRWKNSKKMKEALTIGRIGNKNPSWGSKWMFCPKGHETIKVSSEKIDDFLKKGWLFGRLSRCSKS